MSKQSQHCGPEKNVINVPDRKQCMLPQLSLSSLWKKISQYRCDMLFVKGTSKQGCLKTTQRRQPE